jgi:kinesin family protein 4/21/27
LYEKIAKESSKGLRRYTVYCSYLQIYNEKIFDLLNPSQFVDNPLNIAGLKLRLKNGNFIVDNLYTFVCKNKEDVYDLFQFGLNNRVVATHRFNHTSSRSHSLLTLTIESVSLNDAVSGV